MRFWLLARKSTKLPSPVIRNAGRAVRETGSQWQRYTWPDPSEALRPKHLTVHRETPPEKIR